MKMKTSDSTSIGTLYPVKHIFCAAYLLLLGHQIAHIESDYGEKSTMFFEGEGVERDAMSFFNDTAKKISPKKYADFYRSTKDFLFNNK